MGRYYNGDVNGKFMFAVQSSDAHERFGAVEEESGYVPYVVYRDSYAEICAELDSIKQKGHIDKVEKMFNDNLGYNNERMKEYNLHSLISGWSSNLYTILHTYLPAQQKMYCHHDNVYFLLDKIYPAH